MATELKANMGLAGSGEDLQRWDREHLIHPQYVPGADSRTRIMVKGKGVRLEDADGREYLDATGGLWCAQVGHGRRELAEAAAGQIEQLEFFASFWDFSNEPSVRLAHRLVELAPDNIGGVYFTVGGSESNEIAMMMARMYHLRNGQPERNLILSRRDGYHGITYAARTATGLDSFHGEIGPLPEGYHYLTAPKPYRLENCTDFCVEELERTLAELGADRVAAMIGEPIMGVGGMVVPPDDYWPRIEAVLKQHGILLIFDEVVTAYGRTGTWFGAQQFGVAPDLISTAKGITSGYLPLGAVLVSEQVRDVVLRDPGFVAGFTYTGHPTCCAVALRNLELLEEEDLLENAATIGAYLLERFEELRDLPCVGDVRGKGLMLGIELVKDRETKEPAVELAEELGERFTDEAHVIIRNVEQNLIFSPPLVFTREDCDEVVAAVRAMLEKYGPSA
ncbi:MAG: aspartate aminotransferase family protein [Actinobacteria bacterium]|nr:aspartate aminotransferase family protein [Actinomycetota bacterium]